MGAIVLNGARIGRHCLVGAGRAGHREQEFSRRLADRRLARQGRALARRGDHRGAASARRRIMSPTGALRGGASARSRRRRRARRAGRARQSGALSAGAARKSARGALGRARAAWVRSDGAARCGSRRSAAPALQRRRRNRRPAPVHSVSPAKGEGDKRRGFGEHARPQQVDARSFTGRPVSAGSEHSAQFYRRCGRGAGSEDDVLAEFRFRDHAGELDRDARLGQAHDAALGRRRP